MHYKLHLGAFVISFLAFTGFAATVNYFVDPYDIFGVPRIEGFNVLKSKAGERERVAKAYQVIRQSPRTLIVGNSRPAMGLDPTSLCWSEQYRPIYNLGLPGAGIYMQARYVQHALNLGSVKWIFWGLDFDDFLFDRKDAEFVDDFPSWTPPPREFESRLHVTWEGLPNNSVLFSKTSDQLKGLFSLEGVMDSMLTVLSQKNPNSITREPNGFNPANEYFDIIALEGQEVLFRQTNQLIAGKLNQPNSGIFQTETKWSTRLEILRRSLRFAQGKNVHVSIFINPYHAQYLTAIDLAGKWNLLEDWKRRIVQMAGEEGNGIPVWDFNDFNELTTEPSPKPGQKGDPLKWFWEPTHYRSTFGNLILKKMLFVACEKSQDYQLGVRITQDNLNLHFQRLRSSLTRFKEENIELVERLQSL